MPSNSQPPPVRVPLSLQKSLEEKAYFLSQKDALYQLWVLANSIPGLTTPYPIADGGTGASTAAGARANLSVYSTSEVDSLVEDSKRYALLVS